MLEPVGPDRMAAFIQSAVVNPESRCIFPN
jgi:hypothetical protein